ncbi:MULTISPECIES: DUF1048 domain-containing protein [Bacillus]|uniref:Cytoplasmic protein n=2 Tax=Bacillus TaxID=1386 RepID=A0A0M5JM38_9BACI|nr:MULTISPECIES: DUF1048 domain-containing protein [Bacillus]ALC82901.1 hypothetical protein AM592_15880 [Bacillus gobiensis]MBP1081879.1 DNA-binding ferritin-like protein (Dps family) [Bacillus capparidis]MED1096527.1 DUF1048 domain-containing protein [Bacillus capparidis]
MFKKFLQEKREYRKFRKRINELPDEHKKAMIAIEKYMWMFAKGSGMFEYLKNILEMFEDSAKEGLSVRDIVGNDIAEFADSFLAEFPEETWIDKERKKLRNSIK